jgi:hypothetical protein
LEEFDIELRSFFGEFDDQESESFILHSVLQRQATILAKYADYLLFQTERSRDFLREDYAYSEKPVRSCNCVFCGQPCYQGEDGFESNFLCVGEKESVENRMRGLHLRRPTCCPTARVSSFQFFVSRTWKHLPLTFWIVKEKSWKNCEVQIFVQQIPYTLHTALIVSGTVKGRSWKDICCGFIIVRTSYKKYCILKLGTEKQERLEFTLKPGDFLDPNWLLPKSCEDCINLELRCCVYMRY